MSEHVRINVEDGVLRITLARPEKMNALTMAMYAALADALDWEGRSPVAPDAVRRFGQLVAQSADPIDDVRGSAAYRRHALSVLAARTATWAWDQYRTEVAA